MGEVHSWHRMKNHLEMSKEKENRLEITKKTTKYKAQILFDQLEFFLISNTISQYYEIHMLSI